MTRCLGKENEKCEDAMQENLEHGIFGIFKKVRKPKLEKEQPVRRSKRKVIHDVESNNKRAPVKDDDIQVVETKLEKSTIGNSQPPIGLHEKKSKRNRLYAPHISEIDHAPFSILNYTCPIIISSEDFSESWCLPSIIKAPLQRSISPFRHSLNKFPSEIAEDLLDKLQFNGVVELRKKFIARFSDEEKSWFSWAEKCKESAMTMPWCDALRPILTQLWIGNPQSAASARLFVSRWKKKVIREDESVNTKKSNRKRKDSDSDYEYDDNEETLLNPLIICGPSGTGKTSLISSICEELGMKVLEVHPGEKRNGSTLKAKLAGAIQSHRVQCTGGLASFFSPKSAEDHQKPIEKKQTLIVIEHVDVFFDDDKDYFTTLKNLAAESKVPMIWTCDRLPFQEMNREPAQPYEHLEISRTPSERLAKYARMCVLALTGMDIPLETIIKLTEFKNGDLRAVLNELQFQTASKKDMFLLLEKKPVQRKRLPEDWNRPTISVAPDRQYVVRAKKKQHREIILSTEMNCDNRLSYNHNYNIGYNVMNAINPTGYQVRPVVADYVPYLIHMNRIEMQRKENAGRRYQHYFDRVDQTTGCRIDMTGDLVLALHSFNFNSTPYVPPVESSTDTYILTQL